MSFLIDGPWLYASGQTYGRLASEPVRDRSAKALGLATIATFWGVSIPLYLNQKWTEPIWRACRAKSGRDWMVNSGVSRFDAKSNSPRRHAIAAVIFATYPLWLIAGYRRGVAARR